MHICYVLGVFPKLSETFISDEMDLLLEMGHKVTIISLKLGDLEIIHPHAKRILGQVNIINVKLQSRWRLMLEVLMLSMTAPILFINNISRIIRADEPRWLVAQTIRLARLLKGSQVDHIHVHFADRQLEYAAALSVWLDVPFGFTMHGYDIRDLPMGREKLIDLSNKATKIITVSQANRTKMVEVGLPYNKIEIIPCGIDIKEFFARNSGFSDGKVSLISIARLHPIKSHVTLLKAIFILKSNGINVDLTLVGDGLLRQELETQCVELDISDRVKFVGACTREEVLYYLSQANVHVITSLDEGLCVSNLEAMASGLAVIATAVGGLPEVIRDGVNGLLVKPNDSLAIAEAIRSLVDSPSYMKSLAIQARLTIETDFDRRVLINNFLEVVARN